MAISYPPAQTSSQALAVHRCRFVDYEPSAISAIAFPPLGLPSRTEAKFRKASSASQRRKFGTLAVGRANGNIELYEWSGAEYEGQTPKAWVLSKILYGPVPSKVDSLAFALQHPYLHTGNAVPSLSDLRLFSAGGGSELVEWDLTNGTILRTLNSQGGAIWSISVNPSNSLLALGCEDGCVRLISLEGGSLQHHRRFDRVKCRVLSIAWGPPVPPSSKVSTAKDEKGENVQTQGSEDDSESDDEDDEWTDSWLVTGGSDSALRKWDLKTGRVLDRMSTDKVRGERTLVWAVGVLADGTIISGDSLGIVKFWDSRTCTQLHSFQAHGADVLCLAVGPDGSSVFTSGVDQKVCLFTHISLTNPDKTAKKTLRPTSRWVQSTSKRMHSHDVRALAIWPPYLPISPSTARSSSSSSSPPLAFYSGLAPILVSGGLDASLVLAPCAPASASRLTNPLATSALPTFEDAYHRRVPYPTGLCPAINVARAARLVICAKDTDVSLWRIRGTARVQNDLEAYLHSAGADEEEEEDANRYEKLLDMELDVTTNICASAISPDGRWLAVSDVYEVKLFELMFGEDGILRPKRVKSFMPTLAAHFPKGSSTSSEGASSLCFTPDSGRLVLGSMLSASVLVLDLSPRTEEGKPAPAVLRRFDQHWKKGAVVGKGGRLVRKIPERAMNGANGGGVSESGSDGDGEGMEVDEQNPGEEQEDESEGESEEASHVVITRMAVSPDGQWLATTDDKCRTHIFNLDAVQHHTSLPTSPSPISALAFSPSSPSSRGPAASSASTHPGAQSLILVMAHADAGISVFDVEARRFPEWAAHLARRENLPKRWAALHDGVLGVAFEPPPAALGPAPLASASAATALAKAKRALPKQADAFAFAATTIPAADGEDAGQRHALFWGATWLCRITLDAPAGWGGFVKKRRRAGSGSGSGSHPHRHPHAPRPPPSAVSGAGAQAQSNGNDDGDNDSITNFKLLTRYRPILYVDFFDAGELLVVERPLVDVLRALPPAFFKPRFGT